MTLRDYSCWVTISSRIRPDKIVKGWDFLTAALNFIHSTFPNEITERAYCIEIQTGLEFRGRSEPRLFLIRKDRKLFEWDEEDKCWLDASNGRPTDVWADK